MIRMWDTRMLAQGALTHIVFLPHITVIIISERIKKYMKEE